ncbi:MAG: class I SAM-dependent methyltransferase [Ureaplasma sp.]|nr:class I SAM-dependent methyltransferase [Ureaplasma sp.]
MNNIPIIRKKTAKIINNIINENKYNSLLEIGTAYGFSCNLWIQNKNLKNIVSIEKNIDNYLIASNYVSQNNLKLINGDAFDVQINEKFDLIFLDGPKSNQEILFEKFLNLLNDNGTIVVDNLLLNKFKKLDINQLNKNQRKLLEKIELFRKYLENNERINFTFLNIDDGIGIITKRY